LDIGTRAHACKRLLEKKPNTKKLKLAIEIVPEVDENFKSDAPVSRADANVAPDSINASSSVRARHRIAFFHSILHSPKQIEW
jgi:hypothetical protein